MTNKNDHLCIGHDLCFGMDDGSPVIVTQSYDNQVTLEDLGGIAEWLAEAWEALAGERYKPVVISERGYVADAGVVYAGEHVIPKRTITSAEFNAGMDRLEELAGVFTLDSGNELERDCE